MKKLLLVLVVLILFCGKAITEPEVIGTTLTYKVISYNNIPIEEKPESLIIPIEIRLIDYIKNEKLQADLRFSKLGWISSSNKFNSTNEIYIEFQGYGINITLTDLIITKSNMSGKYYWGYSENVRIKFVAVNMDFYL